MYIPYNILPLDPDSSNQAIMRYPEIQASVSPLRNTSGFPWPEVYKKKGDDDILDWLQAIFGYEVDSVCDDVLSVLARQFVVAAILDLGIGFGTVTHCNVILLHTNVAGFACYD
ncbi:hypothetical protein R6Q59_000008 [Mikania micrantha]